MVVPGGTVVVSVGSASSRTIVLGGRDRGGHGTVVSRVVNEMMLHIYISTVHRYCKMHNTYMIHAV